jgi:hypothetical protein
VQALAEPGAVLITAPVQRQVAGLFVVEAGGCHQLKGVPEPVTLFRLKTAGRPVNSGFLDGLAVSIHVCIHVSRRGGQYDTVCY